MRLRRISSLAIAMAAMVAMVLGGAPARANPANDNFADAKIVPGIPFVETVDTTGATTEPSEPDPFSSCAAAGASIWYVYTPATASKLTATTAGSMINAVVGVYSGPSLDDLGLVGCDAEVNFTPIAGETYYFQVGDMEFTGTDWVPTTGIVTFDLDLYAPSPSCEGCPTFINYAAPNGFPNADGAGETSIGVLKSNATLFQMGGVTGKIVFDDTKDPVKATWTNVSPRQTGITFDPMMWVDPDTGTAIVAALLVAAPAIVGLPVPGGVGGSVIAVSIDEGKTWLSGEPAQTNPAWDHESVGSGPWPASMPLGTDLFPNVTYYCAQMGVSFCQRSGDGGLTWGPQLPMGGAGTACSALHGRPKVSPTTGFVYVPHNYCSSNRQGLLMSTDAATTWNSIVFDDVKTRHFDPVVSFDKAGRGYFFAADRNGKPLVKVSDTNGEHWSPAFDVGAKFHIRNTEFPMAIAGDDGRAALAFYGSPNEGNDQSTDYTGEWHLYVSMTYDAGATWTTQDVTPTDPVQRGCIWAGGISPSGCRNLLDFQGMTIDNFGRVLVGYADGCTSSTCKKPTGTPASSHNSRGVISRQTTGKGLLAEFDGKF